MPQIYTLDIYINVPEICTCIYIHLPEIFRSLQLIKVIMGIIWLEELIPTRGDDELSDVFVSVVVC